MLLLEMSNYSARENRREVTLSEAHAAELEARRVTTGVPVTLQIRRAVESYLKTPHDIAHRLLITERDVRKPANIPDELWDALKDRKAKTGLDLNEQVQIAVALYLQNESGQNQSQGTELELTAYGKPAKEKKPLDVEEEARIRRLIDEQLENRAPSLFEQLRAQGHEVWRAVPAILQKTVYLPLIMSVICGDGDDLPNLVESLGEGKLIEVKGALAEIATEHTFLAIANGWSMSDDVSKTDIRPGDILVMTPYEEYKQDLKTGTVVLAEVELKDGRVVNTLKTWTGKTLKANNKNYKGINFMKESDSGRVIAVCRGALERVFD